MGIETVLELVDFDRLAADADLVITGEGRLDSQSLRGKVVIGVARRAKRLGVPVAALVGSCELPAAAVYEAGVSGIFPIHPQLMSLSEAMAHTREHLAFTAGNMLRFAAAVGKTDKAVAISINFLYTVCNHKKGEQSMRPDGTRVKNLPPLVAAIPYIMPKRYDAWNTITENIDEEVIKEFIRDQRRQGVRLNHMSVIISAYYKASLENPKLNYFVMNRKIYKRNHFCVSFVIMKSWRTAPPAKPR